MRRLSSLVSMLALFAPATAAAGWVDHVQQRVQDRLHADGVSLTEQGYALRLVATSSTSMVVQLTRTDGGAEPKRVVPTPVDVDAAAVEVGIAVASMLPKRDAVDAPPPPAPVKNISLPSTDQAALDATPPKVKTGTGLTDDDRYYLGLSFTVAVGFGSGHFIANAPKGWLFTALDLATAATTTVGIVRAVDRKDADGLALGLIVGGAASFVVARLWELLDLVVFRMSPE